ncbi:MAG: isoleucine--tRNA ligase [Candidatus Moranbacteria bacterium]|nr:isoleucine--tRNA ligase [Candidatus Moranbacteria bacterium]
MFKQVDPKQKYSEMEKEKVDFWKKNKTFEKSVDQRPEDKMFSFYDGPPFITGVPHHGTLLSSVVKDCIPRFWTMKGYRVERRWGWDCHGLPAENMVENKLGIKSKSEIEGKIGIEKFNRTCMEETSKIADEWEEIVDRVGRWVEFKNAYKTMDNDYMESVWWAFKQLYDKDLIYEDVRVSLYCPRCATPISGFEVAMDNSYQMDKDISVYVKMKLAGSENKHFLVWTTTPWTLPANVALAVGKNIVYAEVKVKNQKQENIKQKPSLYFSEEETYIIAKDRLEALDADYEVLREFPGSELIGESYAPLFEHKIKDGYKVIQADFVGTEEGTGIVHLAPAFGEDDFNARKEKGLPIILNVDEEGKFNEGSWEGKFVWEANPEIVGWLKENGFLYRKENITHSYPHCHRCGTKLIYKAQSAWFAAIDSLRDKLLEKNEEINWVPGHLKEGRFKKGIESAPDWNISRDRYWGTAMPVWKCGNKKCSKVKAVGSYEELEELSGRKLEDYHRPWVDEVVWKCEKCGGEMKRIPQVFDCWMESGSMSFAQHHYPFENKEKFKKSFPADFISEYISQTRAWFYVMHVMAVGVFGDKSYKNVLTTGTIAGSDGKKMSKSLGNYTEPGEVLEKYSADALRFYFLSSVLMHAENLNFSEDAIKDIQRKTLGTLWNSYSFFTLYANTDNWTPGKKTAESANLLDRWILSELNGLIENIDENIKKYELIKPCREITNFVDNLSNWHIRRSRRRFWKSENDKDKENAYQTLWAVLVDFSKAIAPICPFISEEVYQNLTGKESVHLENYPEADAGKIDKKLDEKMKRTREIVELGLSLRAESGIKVRQPLSRLLVKGEDLENDFIDLIKDEVNVKEVIFQEKQGDNIKWKSGRHLEAGLDAEITPELQLEGKTRELIREIQETRKKADYEISDRILVYYRGGEEIFDSYSREIAGEVLAKKMEKTEKEPADYDIEKEVSIGGEKITVWLKRVK